MKHFPTKTMLRIGDAMHLYEDETDRQTFKQKCKQTYRHADKHTDSQEGNHEGMLIRRRADAADKHTETIRQTCE